VTAPAEETFDWSDVGESTEARDTNVLPRQPGTARTTDGKARGRGRRSASAKRLDSLRERLEAQMFQSGAMISLGLPVTGTYICQQAETFPDAVIQLAAKRADWVDALEKVADIQPGITIGRTVLGIGAAMGADRYHRTDGESGFDPDKRACQFLGVTAAYYAVYKEDEDGENVSFTPPPHGVFVPVS
jgi:hypothetical protein